MISYLQTLKATFVPVSFLITIAILVIVIGPQVGLTFWWRIGIAAALVLLALIVYFVYWLIQRRTEKQFEAGILGQAQEDMSRATVARRAEMEELIGRWRESIALLRRSNPQGGAVLQTLPWFVIIGEPGSGKSTLLKNSGLDFPIGDARIAGIGGTKNCDWWFANECIVLDTAGRYAFEVQNAPDRAEWDRFLGLLKKTRKRNTINGLLVTLPTDSLLRKDEDELRAYAQHLRGKINDLITRLGIVFPVYLVITKVDLVEGFVDFFQRYPANRVREAVGRTLADVRPSKGIVDASKTLDDLYDRLCSMSLGMMEQEDPGPPARPYLVFPEEYRTLAGRLKAFLQDLLRENIYMRSPVFRGLYLTSGTQEGRSIATVIDDVARRLGLPADSASSEMGEDRPKRTYFVRDLLSSLLVLDAKRDLVRATDSGGRKQVTETLWKVVIPAAAVGILLLAWGFAGFFSNRGPWRDLSAKVRSTSVWAAPAGPVQPAGVLTALRDLDEVRELRANAQDCSAIGSLFMCRSDPDPGQFEKVFTRATETQVLKPTLDRLQQSLEGRPSDLAAYLQDLDAYLSYRKAVQDQKVEDPSRFEGLAAPWGRSVEGQEIAARKQIFAKTVAAYVEMGGRESGGLSFARVADRIQEINRGFGRTDPVSQLRDLSRDAGPVVTSNSDSASILRLWDSLKRLDASMSGGVNVAADLLKRVQANAGALAEAAPAVAPLQQLAAFVSGAGAAGGGAEGDAKAAFDQNVRKPLRDVLAVPRPRCPVIAPPNPDSVKEVVGAIDAYVKELGPKADALKAGIESLNTARPGTDPVAASAIAGLVVPATVAGLYQECSQSWFESEGPLAPGPLRRAFGAGGGGGAPAQEIGPPGDGLFQCLYPIPSSGGPSVDPGAVNAFDAAMRTLMAVREIPGDLRQGLFDQWSSSSASLRSRGGGGDWEPAITKIKLVSSPTDWNLQEIPDKLRGDGSLKTIWSQIRDGISKGGGGGSVAAAAKAFSVDGYVSELDAIANRLGTALEDPSGFGLIDLYSEMIRTGAGKTPFERAVNAVRNAPTPAFKKELEGVPRGVWRKIVDSAQAQLEDLYGKGVRSPMNSLLECYPFAPSGADCRSDQFEAMFGPKGKIGKLAGLADEAPAGTETRFGVALKVGDAFQSFLRSAVPIHRAFVEGAAGDQGGFRLTFDMQVGEIEPVRKVDRKDLVFEVESATLAFGPTSKIQYARSEGASTQKVTIPVDDSAKSRLTVVLGPRPGKGDYTPANAEVGDLPQASGPFSFLRVIGKGAADKNGACCTFDVLIFEKTKKGERGEQIARVGVAFNVVPPKAGGSLVDREFWKIETPPGSVKD